jgi:hypothetical protein
MIKHCWVCKENKEISLFGVNKSKSTGFASECKECKRIKDREYAAKNREKAKQRTKEWYDKNKEYAKQKFKEYGKKWRTENKDLNCAKSTKRRADSLQATPKWLSKEQFNEIKSIYSSAKELQKVFPWKQHVDHIVPLKGKDVCGLHVPWNLQILRAEANISKGNKIVCL